MTHTKGQRNIIWYTSGNTLHFTDIRDGKIGKRSPLFHAISRQHSIGKFIKIHVKSWGERDTMARSLYYISAKNPSWNLFISFRRFSGSTSNSDARDVVFCCVCLASLATMHRNPRGTFSTPKACVSDCNRMQRIRSIDDRLLIFNLPLDCRLHISMIAIVWWPM